MKRSLALFLLLFAIYLLTYTPRINSSDGLAMFSTAESFVRRGAIDIEQIRWMGLQQGTFGLDGLLYSRKGIGVPIGLLPLTWLGFVVPGFGMISASLLFNAIVTALTAVLIRLYLLRLGFTARVGLAIALTFGLSTLAWPYAKSLFSDPFSGLLLLAAAMALLPVKAQGRGQTWFAALSGLLLGWNVATRYAEALFLPFFGLLLLAYLYHAHRETASLTISGLWQLFTRQWRVIFAFNVPLAIVGFSLIAFNLTRYGSAFDTGYLPNETFSGIWWQGILGQLISPGRGLLLYCPIFVLSFWGAIRLWRRAPLESLLAFAIIVTHLLLYGKWFMWHGGYAWGPRFMIPTLPFWAIFLAPMARQAFDAPPVRWVRFSYVCLALLGLIPQLQSVLIDFSPFQNDLLNTGLVLFDPRTFFEWQFSPFVAAWSYIQMNSLDLAWAWRGQFAGWLLLVLLVNIALTAMAQFSTTRHNLWLTVATLSTLISTVALLQYTHTLVDPAVAERIAPLNSDARTGDVILINEPLLTEPFAEAYKGRATVIGLQTGNELHGDIEQRLDSILTQGAHAWWLPNWLPPQESAVERRLLNDGVRTRQLQVGDQRLLLFTIPDATSQQSINQTFAESIELTSVAVTSTADRGRALPFEILWQSQDSLDTDYHIFVHLIDEADQLVAQTDGQPAQWNRPTTTWTPDEQIADRHALWLPQELIPGAYTLNIGLYNPADGQRLLTVDGQDRVVVPLIIE